MTPSLVRKEAIFMDKVIGLLFLIAYFTGLYALGKCAVAMCTKIIDAFK